MPNLLIFLLFYQLENQKRQWIVRDLWVSVRCFLFYSEVLVNLRWLTFAYFYLEKVNTNEYTVRLYGLCGLYGRICIIGFLPNHISCRLWWFRNVNKPHSVSTPHKRPYIFGHSEKSMRGLLLKLKNNSKKN